jgi:hypothetical protein
MVKAYIGDVFHDYLFREIISTFIKFLRKRRVDLFLIYNHPHKKKSIE